VADPKVLERLIVRRARLTRLENWEACVMDDEERRRRQSTYAAIVAGSRCSRRVTIASKCIFVIHSLACIAAQVSLS